MLQLFAHLIGDYFLQSDWMALQKNKKSLNCFVHVLVYSLPFILFFTPSPLAWFAIISTHFFIDRFQLAKYLIWVKNHLNPTLSYFPFSVCKLTGYFDDTSIGEMRSRGGLLESPRPQFITVWLYIITDNALHLMCNYLALKFL
jgi:hypothetical protein